MLNKIIVALTPNDRLLKTKLANGAVVYGKNAPGFGGRGIFLKKDAIEPEFEVLEKFLMPESVFLDIGANTGIYTIKAAHYLKGKGIVIAVEPFVDILAILSYNVQANGFSNVRLRNLGISDRSGVTTLWMNQGKPNSFSLLKRDPEASPLSIMTVTLDDLCQWESLNRIDYIKIDVEGLEAQVLKGGERAIAKYRPIVQLEVLVQNFSANLPEYSIFQAPKSPNRLYIPNEHPKITVAQELGWQQVNSVQSSAVINASC